MVPQAVPGYRPRPGVEDRQEIVAPRPAQGGLCAAGTRGMLDQGDRGDQRPQGPARDRALYAGCRAGPAGPQCHGAAAGAEKERGMNSEVSYLENASVLPAQKCRWNGEL